MPAVPAQRRTAPRHARLKSDATIDNANRLLKGHVRPAIGPLWVDRTQTARIEQLFAEMAEAGYATSTIDHTWDYLNQACGFALRQHRVQGQPGPGRAAPRTAPGQGAQGAHDRPGPPESCSRRSPRTATRPCG